MTPIGNITRKATRHPGEPLNILTYCTHERVESHLAKTGHNFYAIQGEGIKTWNERYAPIPTNYVILNGKRGDFQVPAEVDFDLILAQSIGHFQISLPLSKQFHLPLVRYEHTLPVKEWGLSRIQQMRQMDGDLNVFISEFSKEAWLFKDAPNARVVHHGLDVEKFAPGQKQRQPVLLSVVNDWVNRDYFCGFNFWREATSGLPTKVFGSTPGLSEPAKDVEELIDGYQTSQIFINSSIFSPIPTAVLEAMACGCAVISTGTCMLPEVIAHGENGILCSSPEEMKQACSSLLNNPEECRRLGQNARKTIEERFSLDRYVTEWNQIFEEASQIVFKG